MTDHYPTVKVEEATPDQALRIAKRCIHRALEENRDPSDDSRDHVAMWLEDALIWMRGADND